MQSIHYKLKNGLGKTTKYPEAFVVRHSAAIRIVFSKKAKKSVDSQTDNIRFGPNVARGSVASNASQGNKHKKKRTSKKRRSKSIRGQSTTTPHAHGSVKAGSPRSSNVHNRKSRAKSIHRKVEMKTTRNGYITKMKPELSSGTNKICDSPHDGRLIIKENLRLQVDVLFNLLFSSTSKFLTDFHAKRNSTDLNMGPWKTNKDGLQMRTVNVTVALQASVGPKTSKVTESQTIRSCSAPGELYSIDIETVNEGIPYADVFNIVTHYCLIRSKNNSTDMLVFANVNFIKSTWAVIKAFIVKHSYEGLSDFFQHLHEELLLEAAKREKK